MFSFGGNNTSTATTSAPAGGFSFGASTTTAPTTNSTSLFGNTSNATSTTTAAPASGFSFGTTTTTPTASTATSTPSLFGNTSSASTSTSLFGNTSSNTPASTTFSLSTPATTGGASTGLSLGSTTTSTSTPTTSLFGATTPSASTTTTTASNTSAPSAPINPQSIVRTTKFSELPEDAKKMIEEIEKSIQSQIHSYDYVTARETPDFINKVSEEAQVLNEKLVGLKFSLERDMELISNLNKTMNKEIKNAEIAGRGINALKSPNNHHVHFPGVRLTFDYFWNLVTSFESRMLQYKHNIEDIERHLSSIAQTARFSPGALTEIMRNQHETFLAIAGKVATLHSAVKRQKELYLNYRRRVYNDDKSPFPEDVKKSQKIPKISDDSESLMISMLQPTASTYQAPQASGSATGGLFGQSTAGTTTSSLFGSTAPANSTTTTGGGLFGSTTPATGTSGGLFGNTTSSAAYPIHRWIVWCKLCGSSNWWVVWCKLCGSSNWWVVWCKHCRSSNWRIIRCKYCCSSNWWALWFYCYHPILGYPIWCKHCRPGHGRPVRS
ncbi:hypothetical protein K493DRAFT_3406 [Basidiobolus meristosporus CBS 931.73]|uniref:Nucleoporin p58/p45 n=1 Tax=Basidiobolus meristosporus CBS 931.73 TaxID=1314790 RepID=A0A1Y1YN45_9FUNG|nr:hypothetical protein K493DRAFT_3406 [Basidiobolus meristosporus CBS 931.73]|eukprot:ORX98994.1 hypothetical protein K493DRAFT_3406 [Basidiobolus meristosporus CBS 931.73]